jgi:Predicted AAA-ATPase/PD-(D/E)XK nuclease superfamily
LFECFHIFVAKGTYFFIFLRVCLKIDANKARYKANRLYLWQYKKIISAPNYSLMLPKLPIGIQDFEKLRQGDFVYIDKTEHVHKLVTGAGSYFLARPRRFGKSLLASIFRYLFEGRRDLFKDLWIENHWDWEKKHPVIRLSFANIGHKELGLHQALIIATKRIAKEHQVRLVSKEPSQLFEELIRKVSTKHGKVAIIIDEYDKPIIDFLAPEEMPQAHINRAILKGFFGILKDADPYIRFLFLTGVSKFSKVSIFSDLNHLQDIGIDPNFSTICGCTQAELLHYFQPYFDEMPVDTLERMTKWYNGYSWDGKIKLYNPFSILYFFAQRHYHNFWFSTGTPTFLVKRLNPSFQYSLSDIEIEPFMLDVYNLEALEPVPLLFQTGYLTIKEITPYGTYILDYPNLEVKESLVRSLLADYTHEDIIIPRVHHLRMSLNTNDLAKTIQLLNGLFKSIPNQIFIANREAYYHSIVYLTFVLLGVYIQAEVNSSDGRLDAIVHTPERIFIFEFKLYDTAEAALQQIRDKDYATPFRHLNKEMVGVGVHFSEQIKGIDAWVGENV